jgi:hypothetical protein
MPIDGKLHKFGSLTTHRIQEYLVQQLLLFQELLFITYR